MQLETLANIVVIVAGLAFICLMGWIGRKTAARPESMRFGFDELPERFKYDLTTQIVEVYEYLGCREDLPDLEKIKGAWVWLLDRNGQNEIDCWWLPQVLVSTPKYVLDAGGSERYPIALVVSYEELGVEMLRVNLVSAEWSAVVTLRCSLKNEDNQLPGCQIYHRTAGVSVMYLFEENSNRDRIRELILFAKHHAETRPDAMMQDVLSKFDFNLEHNQDYAWVPHKIQTSRRAYKENELLIVHLGHNPSTDKILEHLGIRKEHVIPKRDATSLVIPGSTKPVEESNGPN